MTADVTLRLLLTSVDKSASRGLSNVGREAGQAQSKMGKMGAIGKGAMLGIAAGLATAGLAALDFGKDSLAAFADADKSQKSLEDAYRRYPALAKVNIDALREYNDELQRKTGADADDLAASQASLAAFKLNGKQIKAMSPLLVDYAAKTGKTLPESAKLMGKALLGNTRALKDLGISYKSTGDPAKDYANIMALVKEKVGGYAESLPEAERKSKILAASFGDLQESVGEKLQPAMIALTNAGQGVLDWLDQNPEVAAGAAAAFDLLGDALQGIWFVVRKFVAPAIAWLLEGFANATRGLGVMLDALGTIPGFEWAKEAAAKVNKTADGIDAVAAGLKALANDPPPTVDIEDRASATAAAIQTKMDGIKDKIVTAKAKGDDKEADRLRRKLEKLAKRRFNVLIVAGVTMNKAKDEVVYSMAGHGSLKFSARRRGGPVTRGMPYIVGEDEPELFVPDVSGRVLNGQQMRAAAASSRAIVGAGGVTYITNNNVDVRGVLTEAQAGQKIEEVLAGRKQARRGRPLAFEGARR